MHNIDRTQLEQNPEFENFEFEQYEQNEQFEMQGEMYEVLAGGRADGACGGASGNPRRAGA